MPAQLMVETRSRRRPKNEVSCCIKYIVFAFNVTFWLIGGFLIGISLWAWYEKDVLLNIKKIEQLKYLDPALILLIAGTLMFSIGFCGCIGALRENKCLLLIYSISISIILFLQIAAAVVLFSFKDWVLEEVTKGLRHAIVVYRDDEDLQGVIDWVQGDWLQCCGVEDYNDWEENMYFSCKDGLTQLTKLRREKCSVPHSCCRRSLTASAIVAESAAAAEDAEQSRLLTNLQCGYSVREKGGATNTIYTRGCIPAGTEWLKQNIIPVAAVSVSLALIQIFSICLAQSLRTDIQAQMDQWRYQH